MTRSPISTARYVSTAATVVAAPLILGTVHLPVIAGIGIVVLLTSLARYFVPRQERSGSDLIAVVLLCLTAAAVFQMVPLPPRILQLLSRESWNIQSAAFRPLGVGERTDWMSISLDRGATALEVAKLAVAFLAYQNARDIAWSRSRTRVLTWVVFAGACVAVVGIAHFAAGATNTLYGVFQVRGDSVTGPFVNGNHQAGLLALASAAAVGLTLDQREWRGGVLWGSLALLIMIGGLLARSRGGTVAIFFAVAFPIAVHLVKNRGGANAIPFVLISTFVLVAVVGGVGVANVFADHETGKFEIWRPTPRIIGDFPLTGIGRGAFPFVYPQYQSWNLLRTFTHVENVPIQLVVDYGIPLGGACILAWILGLRRLFVRRRSILDLAIAAGAIALFLQNLVDFNLEILGVAIPALAALAARSRGESSGTAIRMPRGLLLSVMAVFLYGIGVAYAKQMPFAEAQVRAVLAADDPNKISHILRNVLRDHPADYFIPLLAADREASLMDGDRPLGRPLPWINRVLTLYPRSFEAHRMTARWFRASRRHQQALVEYRLALDCAPHVDRQPGDILHEIIVAYPISDLLSRLTVAAERPVERLEALVRALDLLGKRELANDADRSLLQLQPADHAALMRLSGRAQASESFSEMEAVARQVAVVDPAEAAYLNGRVAAGQRRYGDAVRHLTKATELKATDVRFWIGLAQAAAGATDRALARSALERARLAAKPEQLAHVFFEAGWLWKGLHEPAAALQAFEKALALSPDWTTALDAAATLADELQRYDLALTMRKRLAALTGKH